MKAHVIRWMIAVVMLAAMALLISSPALAEVHPLPLDIKEHGYKPLKEGWSSKVEYKDESIEVTYKNGSIKAKSSSTPFTIR